MQWTQATAEKRLSELKMPDMPITTFTPRIAQVPQDWYPKYKNLVREFARSLSDCVEELAMMNLGREEFMDLLMGRAIPPNLSIRLRIPLIWGGKIDMENMYMCHTFPHSQNLDRFIIEQKGNETVWLPTPAKKIYLPIHSTISGNGGNAVADRLSQIAAGMSNRQQNRG